MIMARTFPIGIRDPEDLAGAVIVLCSDAGTFMTGTGINVNGEYVWI